MKKQILHYFLLPKGYILYLKKTQRLLFFALMLLAVGLTTAHSQGLGYSAAQTWAGTSSNGNSGYPNPSNAVFTDASGNTYITGGYIGIITFGTITLTATNASIFIVKMNSAGNTLWAESIGNNNFGNNNLDFGYGITTDASGNVLVTGVYDGFPDFDPGPGVANIQTENESSQGQAFVLKLSSTGAYIWVKGFWCYNQNGTRVVQGNAIAVDVQGNVYTTGSYYGTIDLDPGPGSYTLKGSNFTGPINLDKCCYISKLDAAGNFVWGQSIGTAAGTSNNTYGQTIKLDNTSNNIYVAGGFSGSDVDFDASANVFNMSPGTATLPNAFLLKITTDDAFVWAKAFSTTGSSVIYGMAVDVTGNIFTTGTFSTTTDFDPSANTQVLTPTSTNDNAFVSKLDAAGNYIWAKALLSTSAVEAYSIALDVCGNIYTSGSISGATDFDPGSAAKTFAPTSTFYNSYISKLDASGNYAWAGIFGESGASNSANSIAVNAAMGYIYAMGQATGKGTIDFDPSAGTQNLTTTTAASNYLCKLSPYSAPVISNSSQSVSTTISCNTDANGNLMFVDPANQSNKYLAIYPNGNMGYDFNTTTPIAANNSPIVANQMKTNGTTNTTALSNRMYTIKDAGVNNYPSGMTVRLYFDPADITAATTALDAAVNATSTGQWFKISGTNHAVNVATILANQSPTGVNGATLLTPSRSGTELGVSYVEFNDITSFSTFGYLASKSTVVLPVLFTNFTASANNCSVNLAWQTKSETNSNHYDIEQSINGNDFTKVGAVNSINSQIGGSYHYVDNLSTSGIHYYRLKAVDNDAKFTYSEIVSIINNCIKNNKIAVYPNPTTDLITVEGITIGSRLQLVDLNGKKMKEFVAASTYQPINVANYAKGVYILRVYEKDGGIHNIKILKQ